MTVRREMLVHAPSVELSAVGDQLRACTFGTSVHGRHEIEYCDGAGHIRQLPIVG